jgi:hypothetical protein
MSKKIKTSFSVYVRIFYVRAQVFKKKKVYVIHVNRKNIQRCICEYFSKKVAHEQRMS